MRRQVAEGERCFIDGWQITGAVKAATGGTKPKRGPRDAHYTQTGRGMAETGKRSGAA